MKAYAFVPIAFALNLRQQPVYDVDDPHRMQDSFGRSTLEHACTQIECGALSCDAPFELKKDETCCGYCWAPDHVVGLDRHTAFNSPFRMEEMCASAPSSCRGPGGEAQCFQPSCRSGEVPHCGAGACCPVCTATSAAA